MLPPQEDQNEQPARWFDRLGKASTILFLTLGFLAAWNLLFTLCSYLLMSTAGAGGPSPTTLKVTTAGEIVLAASGPSRSPSPYQSLDGKRLALGEKPQFLDPAELPSPVRASVDARADDPSCSVIAVNVGDPATYWYFVTEIDRGGMFVGYDATSNQCIGYIGTKGFERSTPSNSDWFSVDTARLGPRLGATADFTEYSGHLPAYKRQSLQPGGRVYLLANDDLYEVDLVERLVHELVFDERVVSMDLGSVRGGLGVQGDGRPSARARGVSWRLFLRTASNIIVYDPRTRVDFRYSIPDESSGASFSIFAVEPTRAVMVISGSDPRSRPVVQIDEKGDTTQIGRTPSGPSLNPGLGSASTWHAALVAPLPLAYGVYASLIMPSSLANADGIDYGEALAASLRACFPIFLMLSAASTLCAVVLRRSVKACEISWKVWLLLLLFGPLAIAAFWLEFVRGKVTPRSIPEPEMLGTEILL